MKALFITVIVALSIHAATLQPVASFKLSNHWSESTEHYKKVDGTPYLYGFRNTLTALAYMDIYELTAKGVTLVDSVSFTDFEGDVECAQVEGNYLYLLIGHTDFETFFVYDVSNPLQPVYVTSFSEITFNGTETAQISYGFFVDGNLLMADNGWSGVYLWDMSDPANPQYLGDKGHTGIFGASSYIKTGEGTAIIHDGYSFYSAQYGQSGISMNIWADYNDLKGSGEMVWHEESGRIFTGFSLTGDSTGLFWHNGQDSGYYNVSEDVPTSSYAAGAQVLDGNTLYVPVRGGLAVYDIADNGIAFQNYYDWHVSYGTPEQATISNGYLILKEGKQNFFYNLNDLEGSSISPIQFSGKSSLVKEQVELVERDLRITVPQSAAYTITVHSPSGRELFRESQTFVSGSNTVTFNDNLWGSGMVLLTLEGPAGITSHKVLLK